MSEPYLTTRDMVERIESNVAALQDDVHKIQITLAQSSGVAAESVIMRAKTATWAAAGSGLAATAAVIVAIVKK